MSVPVEQASDITGYIVNGLLTTVVGALLGWVIERLKESNRIEMNGIIASINRVENAQEQSEKTERELIEKIHEQGQLIVSLREAASSYSKVQEHINASTGKRLDKLEQRVEQFGKVIRKP